MNEDEASQSAAVVYVGFGQVMHKFQLIEMNLWSVKALHFKAGIQEHPAFAKLARKGSRSTSPSGCTSRRGR